MAQPLKGGVDAALDVAGHAHVPGQRQHRLAGLGGDLLRGGFQRARGPGRDDDVTALTGQGFGHAAPDALTGTGDESYLSVQPQIHRNPFRLATALCPAGVFPPASAGRGPGSQLFHSEPSAAST